MTEVHHKMKQDTWMTLLSRIPVMLLSFISMAILTRWLGPEGNGIYTFVFANINLLLLLFGLQSETAVLYYLAKKDADANAVISLSLWTVMVSFLVCSGIIILLGYFIPAFQQIIVPADQPYAYFVVFILLSFIFRKSLNTFLAIQRATLSFKAFNMLQLIAQIIPVLFYGYGFFITANSETTDEVILVFNYILVAQALISLAGLLFILIVQKLKMTLGFRSQVREFFTYSTKSTLDAIAKFINRRIDIYFIHGFQGVNPLGQYGLASQIGNFAQEAILPFTQVMNPYLVKSNEEERIIILTRMARIIFTLTLLICIGIIIFSPFIIPVLFGKAFIPSILATQILSLSVVVSTQRLIFASYFQSINRLKYNIQSNWLGVIMTIILDIILIPLFGIEGAAWASIMAYFTSFMYLFIRFSSHTQVSLKEIIILRKEDIRWLLKEKKKID